MAVICFSEIDLDKNGYLTRDEIEKVEELAKEKGITLFVGITADDIINEVTREEKLKKAKAFFGCNSNTYYGVGDEPIGSYGSSYDDDDYMLMKYTDHCLHGSLTAKLKKGYNAVCNFVRSKIGK